MAPTMMDPKLGIVDPADVFTADEYIEDEEGAYFAGNEIAFAEYDPEDDTDVYNSEQDMYEPDVFDEFDD